MPKLFRKLNALTLVALASALVGCSDPSSTDSMAAAKGHMAKQEWSSAVVELKSALQKAPNSGEARYLLGVALLEQGLEAQAAVELGKASEAGFDDEQLAPKLARAWLGTGRPKEVVQTYRKTSLNRAHEQAELKTALAVAYARLNQRAEAEAAVDEALRADPRHPWALVTKARVHASSGKFDEAMKLLDVAMVPGSSNGEAQLLRAALFRIIKKDNESARKAYLQAALDSQTAMQARTALVQMALTQSQLPEAKAELAELKKAYPKHPHVHFVEALVAYAEKDFARTEGIIEQLLRLAPDNPQLLVLGGAANLQRGGLLGAETKLGKVVQTVERMPVARKLLADTYLRAGQPDKALTTLRPLIESARPDGDAMALAGQAHLHAGRPQEAEAHFAAAAKLKPDDVQVKTALALTELVKGQPEAAFDALAQIAAGDTGDTADLALISAFMRRKEFDRALEAIAKLEKKTPTKAVALHLRGLAMRGKRDEPGARGAFEEALKADPLYFASTAALASMEVEARNLDAATTRLEAAVRAAPRNTAARMAHLNVLRAKGASHETLLATIDEALKAVGGDPDPHVAKIAQLLKAGDVKAATAAAQVAMAALPNSVQVLEAAGSAFADAGDNQQAVSAFNRLATLMPRSPLPHLSIADVHAKRGDRPSVEISIRRAYEVAPESGEVHRRLLRQAVMSRDFKAAQAIAKDLQRRRPDSSLGFLLEGDVEAARKAWAAAGAAYRLALGKSDARGRPQVKLHGTVFAGGDTEGAAKFAAEWLKSNPKDLAFREYLGVHALRRGDLTGAGARFREILAIVPEHPVALNNLAWILAERREKGAVELAQRAVAATRSAPPFMDTLAKALAAEGQLTQAIEVQSKVVAALPERHDFRLSLARYLVKANEAQRAKPELDRLAALGAQFAGQAEVAELRKGLPASAGVKP